MARFTGEARRFELAAGTFGYLEAGRADGPVALCLHGFPDHPRSFEPLLPALLEAGYRVVAPWIRGYAPSTCRGPFEPQRLGADAVELAAACAPDGQVMLIGHDWGAIAGWHAVSQAPHRFSSFAALSVPHPRALVANVRRHPQQLLRSWYIGFFQLPWLPERLLALSNFAVVERLYRTSSVPPGRKLAYGDELRRTLAESMPAPLGPYRSLRRTALGLPLPITRPTIFLTGALDPAVSPAVSHGQERYVRAPFESHVLEDAGHFLHHDKPAEVAGAILRFASEQSAAA